MGTEPPSQHLPFEPAKNRKKKPKNPSEPQVQVAQEEQRPKAQKAMGEIPEAVSRRMIGRMGLFCGLPTSMGLLTFIVSYVVVSNHWFPLPNSAVVLVSMAFFGLGVLGLSYGVLSASWDETIPGSKLGWQEFTINWGRMQEAWRSAKPKS
ncbi:MAG: PAM68 family protein [Actinomycetota bacterium]